MENEKGKRKSKPFYEQGVKQSGNEQIKNSK